MKLSKSAHIVQAAFTTLSVAISYLFYEPLSKWLQAQQPQASGFIVGIEVAAIFVVPAVIFTGLIIRSLQHSDNEEG